MTGFSIDAALRSGFSLARREWKTVLAWGAGAFGLAILMQLLIMGPALPGYIAEVGTDPEGAAAAMEEAMLAHAWLTYPLMILAAFVTLALFYGAVCRAMLRPDERGFFYLRFGRGELWLLLTALALYGLMLLALIPAALLVGLVVAGISMAGGTPWFWAILLCLPLGIGGLYVAARLSPAWIMAWDEERFVLADAWRLTRGHGWRIVLMMLALFFLLLIVMLVVLIPSAIVAFILVSVAGMAGGVGGTLVLAVLALAALVWISAYYGVFYTVALAPYVEVYRELKAGAVAAGP
ncbi:hypothetical protein [Phenylobacterium sp. J367]|uniref:hypothetical protein n=1 Tax=Phenylobacterium sp. J367 TaxID=2898435 RepID=UPI002150B7F6|nr:hypothetical protein [Phenylobacterium sp. J367]MCR5877680.1 hypothetical protein [Phenylobacterium sp. J367]